MLIQSYEHGTRNKKGSRSDIGCGWASLAAKAGVTVDLGLSSGGMLIQGYEHGTRNSASPYACTTLRNCHTVADVM